MTCARRASQFLPGPLHHLLLPCARNIKDGILRLSSLGRYDSCETDMATIVKFGLLRPDYFDSPHLPQQNQDEAVRRYVRSWASGVGRRKLFPGFHPGMYHEQHGVEREGVDPLADYLRAGRPQGPWNFEVLTPSSPQGIPLQPIRVGLHIHAYYPDLFPELLNRLKRNRARPDLFISVTSEWAREMVTEYLVDYTGGGVDIRVVPNRGRDIGPFLVEFGETLFHDYDVIGHLHTKKTVELNDESIGRNWYRFLLENLLGGQASMADIILSRMAADPTVAMVFPDDPNVVGWDKNFGVAERLLAGFGIQNVYREICFPVGNMFWARPAGLKALFDLKLRWEDYPEEPLPYDGTMLHALERICGLLPVHSGRTIVVTNVPGFTR